MITLHILDSKEPPITIKPTIFPDKTSQVWKIGDFEKYNDERVVISWYWEEESELIWVNQLICLLYQNNASVYELYIPYLPYGRQDKGITNETTFAKEVFLEILLKEHVLNLTTLDAHSHHRAISQYDSFTLINKAYRLSGARAVVFPDKGAYDRYSKLLAWTEDIIVLDKVRNQLTGKIESICVNKEYSTISSDMPIKLLIIDDISDYGGTFKQAAKVLRELYPNIVDISLYVTHFLGHGGVDSFTEAGISKIFTSNSLDAYRTRYNLNDDRILTIGERNESPNAK